MITTLFRICNMYLVKGGGGGGGGALLRDIQMCLVFVLVFVFISCIFKTWIISLFKTE